MMALGSLACSFSGAPSSASDLEPDAAALPDEPDAATDATACVWGPRAFFDPCGADADEFSSPAPGSFVIPGAMTFDTDSGAFETGELVGLEHRAANLGGAPVYLWIVNDLGIPVTGKLTITGSLPLVIAAHGDIDIAGTVDLSSAWNQDGSEPFGGVFVTGAGGALRDCGPAPGLEGLNGAGGGGGGGFGSAGGAGGDGSSGAVAGASAGDVVPLQTLSTLTGGCAGGLGGPSGNGSPATRSPGGGGLLLSAVGRVTVTGTLAANGAGGIGQFRGQHNGGGGGGSGGLIAIQGAEIEAVGQFFANGGGGGGGANGHKMATPNERAELIGEDGKSDPEASVGAIGESGSTDFDDGGDSATIDSGAQAGTVGLNGGGGGGGGLGHIALIRSSVAVITNAASFASPIPVVVAVDLVPEL